jgi:preprotein translocase subunit SecG
MRLRNPGIPGGRVLFPARTGVEKTGNSPLYKVGTAPHSPAPMTFAAIDWLSISINLLLVIFVIVCLLMTLLILMQRPKQEGLGAAFGGGVTDQVFGARTTNVLQRGTVYLGSMFFLISLGLAILIGQQNKYKTIITEPGAAKVEEAAAATPKEEVAPKSLSEELPVDLQAPVATPADVPADAPETAPAEVEVAPVEPAPAPETAPEAAPAPAESEAPKDN